MTEIDRCRRVYLVTYGGPPDPPATAAFAAALHTAARRYKA
ncbi:hypothetical protein AB0K52_12935 [Glycomyces sp. NPDC049804]